VDDLTSDQTRQAWLLSANWLPVNWCQQAKARFHRVAPSTLETRLGDFASIEKNGW
jgi:hypothetical protein